MPIGRPIDNTVCRILDPAGELVPVGVPGELYIGGEGVARGYQNRPELTAERFVADPLPGAAAGCIGPATWPAGAATARIEFLGRGDHQVKVRGPSHRAGRDRARAGHPPRCQSRRVTTWEPAPGDVRLVGYYLPRPRPARPAELRDHLGPACPAYMIPSSLRRHGPRSRSPPTTRSTANSSPTAPHPRDTTTRERRPPQTRLHAQLIDIWANVLGHHDIGIDDDFFDLGGHSLLAIRVFAAVERVTGQRPPLSSLFQAPTIASFAELLEQDRPDAQWTSLVPVQPAGITPGVLLRDSLHRHRPQLRPPRPLHRA